VLIGSLESKSQGIPVAMRGGDKNCRCILGCPAAKVDAAIRNGTAALVLHAFEAAEDGVRKLDQARRSVVYAGGPEIPALSLFESSEMDLALGGVNVIHAAVLKGTAAAGFVKRAWLLQHFRDGRDDRADAKAAAAAKETETE